MSLEEPDRAPGSSISGAMALTVDESGNFNIVHEPAGSRFTFSTAARQATINSFGTYVLTIECDFTLGDKPVGFPKGQPDWVVVSDVETSSFTLNVYVSRDLPPGTFPATVTFEIYSKDQQNPIIDPTILVDPPG